MRDIRTSAISNYFTDEGKKEVYLQSDGEYIKFNIDTGSTPSDISTSNNKPSDPIEIGLKKVKYCDSSGEEYEMYIIASDAWKSSSSSSSSSSGIETTGGGG